MHRTVCTKVNFTVFKVLKISLWQGNELVHRTQDVLSTEDSQTLTHQTWYKRDRQSG